MRFLVGVVLCAGILAAREKRTVDRQIEVNADVFKKAEKISTAKITERTAITNPACKAEVLTLDSSVEGTLAIGQCRIAEVFPGSGSTQPVKRYQLDISTSTAVVIDLSSAQFDTILVVQDDRLQTVGLNNDFATGSTDSQLTAGLTPGTYYVLVSPRTGAGSFKLQVTSQPLRDCVTTDLPTGTSTGELNATGCRVLDAAPPNSDEVPAQFFRFSTSGPSTVLRVDMRSGAFDTFLRLFNARTGVAITQDDDGGGNTDSRITISLPAGDYLLAATSFDISAGPYELDVALEPPPTCTVSELELTGTTQGELADQDCRLLDYAVSQTFPSRADGYRLRITENGLVSVQQTSTALFGLLAIADEQGRIVAISPNNSNSNPTLTASLPVGTYTLLATTRQGLGAYSLRAVFEKSRECPPTAIGLSDTATGTFAGTDCRILDALAFSSDQTLLKIYNVELTARTMLTVDMTSTVMDSFLWLFDTRGGRIAVDDDSGGNFNARLTVQLDPGTYRIFANNNEAETGAFAVRTSTAEPRTCEQTSIAVGDTVTAQWAEGDCAVRDVVLSDSRATPAKYYRLDLTQEGEVTIDLCAMAVSPSVTLVDQTGRRLAVTTLTANGVARIRGRLVAGVYGIVVTPNVARAADFELKVNVK